MGINGKQLAKLIGISEAAISMAINDKPGVSKKRKEEIIKLAKEYGYDFVSIQEKNNIGTIYLLAYGESGAVVKDSPFFLSLINGLKKEAKKSSYGFEIIYIHKLNDIDKTIKIISDKPYSGAILLATEISEKDFNSLKPIDIPFIVLDATYTNIKYDSVCINNFQGGYLACKHLIENYHTIPSYLASTFPITNFSSRMEGFNFAIHELGFSTSRVNIIKLTPSEEGAYADMNYLLNRKEKIDRCYFADNDLIALGAIRALKEHGYKIPKDVAIVGFDNIDDHNNLSSISVDKEFLGKRAIESLIYRIKNMDKPNQKVEISPTLIIKNTSIY